ncbi:MAG: hypothetical protein JWQ50_9848 [Caballeronia mineralivorans]|jgi:hypothetical protein|nr:hypothetical protein [Caballeronia mineralivorans]MEA3103099.1 hypothetical protein [Caballeronia mineralivorans]
MRTIVRIILSTVEKYFWNLVRIRNLTCLQLKEHGVVYRLADTAKRTYAPAIVPDNSKRCATHSINTLNRLLTCRLGGYTT